MKSRMILVGMVLLAGISGALASQRDHLTGKIVGLRQRTRDRVLLYQVDTPILTEEPYVTVSVDVNGLVYEAEFEPRTSRELFSTVWKPEETVMVRLEKHLIYLQREDGSEARFLITSKPHPRPARESH